MENKIFNNSQYQQAIKMVLQGVAGDTITIKTGNSNGNNTYKSITKDIKGKIVTKIFLNKKLISRVVYDYETGTETETINKEVV